MEDPDYIRRYVRENHTYTNRKNGQTGLSGFSQDHENPEDTILDTGNDDYHDDHNTYELTKKYNKIPIITTRIDNFVELYTDKIIHYIHLIDGVYTCTRKILEHIEQNEDRYYLILRDP